MRGTVGILTGRGPACDALAEWLEGDVAPHQPQFQIRRIPGNQIAYQRNVLVSWLRPDDDFLLFVDHDVIPPRGTIQRLWSHHVGVVGAMIIARGAPFDLAAVKNWEPYERYRIEDFPRTEERLLPVQSIGTGCLMIRRAVFDALPGPYWFRVGQVARPDLLNEDADFCLRAAAAGFPTFMDCGLRPGHRTDTVLYAGDAEILMQMEGPHGPLPYRVTMPVEEFRVLHL